jgi:TRAP-type mannitol/chloroaromatic compound transport system permease small subunit
MSALRIILHAIDKTNEWVAKIIGWVVVLMIGATVYEVVMRYVFNAPTEWVFEFNYLVHGPYFLLLGAYTLALRGHVNVDILYGRLSLRNKAIVDLATAPIFFFFLFMMLRFGCRFALNSFAFRETLSSAWAPPIYPIKMIIPIAAGLLILQGLAKFIRDLHLALTGREGEI